MMKRRMLTGTLAMMMVVSALSTGMVFADETTTDGAVQGRGGAEKIQMMQDGVRGQGGKEAKEENRAEQQEKMQGVIDEYYPEISDEWNEVHEDMKTTTDAIRDLRPEKSERPERPEGTENGERPEKSEGGRKQLPEGFDDMTDEEKLAAREEMKANAPDGERPERGNKGGPRGGMDRMFGEDVDFENMTDEEIEALKAEREAIREERKEQHEAFETAVEEGDADTIQDILDEMLENAQERLVKAEEKLAELQAAE